MIAPVPIGRREQRRNELRRALQEAAWHLVADRGYDALTVDDIATAAGTSIATFYRNFSGKEAVLTRRWLSPERLVALAPHIDRRHGLAGVVSSLFQTYGRLANEYSVGLMMRLKVINQNPGLQLAMNRGRAEDEYTLAQLFAEVTGQPADSLALRLAASLTIAARATTMAHWAELNDHPPLTRLLDETAEVLAPSLAACEDIGALAQAKRDDRAS